MANLLPISEKLRIQQIYKSRLLITILFFSFSVMGFGVITLLPPFFLSFVKERIARERLNIVEQVISAEEQKNMRENVSEVNRKIALFSDEQIKFVTVSESIEKIIAQKNPNISLVAFFYEDTPADGRGQIMNVSGISRDRHTLLSFVNQLREQNIFSKVNLPVSNFVRNTDIPFSISLLIRNNAVSQ